MKNSSSYQGKFQWNFDQVKGNLVQVSWEFELSKFEFLRFYCISSQTSEVINSVTFDSNLCVYV